MEYNFTLKDNNQRTFRLFVWFLFFLHLVASCALVLNTADANTRLSIYILIGFYTLVVLGYYFLRKRVKAFDTFSLIMALLYANFWLKHVGFLALMIFVGVYLFVLVVQGKKTTVAVSAPGVYVTRIFKTVMYNWTQIDNVILKDNLLTLDLRSNKIIQAEVVESMDTAGEIKFNDFCSDQLKNNFQQTVAQS